MSIDQFGPFRPKPRTEIGGLYLAGASQAWGPGVEGAMLSGLHAAGAALNRDLAREVRAGLVLGDRAKLTGGGPGWDPLLASKRMSRKPRAAALRQGTRWSHDPRASTSRSRRCGWSRTAGC